MSILSITSLQHRVGTDVLFNGASLQLHSQERVAVVGRNGAGKSTLLRIIAKELEPDSADRQQRSGLKVARLLQEVPPASDESVYDVVAAGAGVLGEHIAEYHRLGMEGTDLDRMAELQTQIEAEDGWSLDSRVQQIITRLNLPADARLADLSGGWRRRVWLGRVLLNEPDILLLDEPTNHLDIAGIDWLEQFALSFRGCLVFISHDRAFTQKLATRVMDIDRGQISSWEGDFANYIIRKAEALEAEERHQAEFDKKLAQEEVWIRQGIKARRTRNEGRVRALKALRKERGERRNQVGQAKMTVGAGEASGKVVFKVKNLFKAFDNKKIITDFSTLVLRGDSIGLIGPNGIGKTTLLKLLLGQLEADEGTIKQGTNLRVAWFDQQREQLDDEARCIDWIGDGKDELVVGGKPRHVVSYLQDFLFTPDRARNKIGKLSGGERNRLLLAKLFLRDANLLILDEPTNDLDVETLELLEEQLANYKGTVLLVSHDREFIDNVVTSSWVFDGRGNVVEYAGGYSDYRRQLLAGQTASPTEQAAKQPAVKAKSVAKPAVKSEGRKLTYAEQKELAGLPAKLEKLEGKLATLQEKCGEDGFYQQARSKIAPILDEVAALEEQIKTAYSRWEELDSV